MSGCCPSCLDEFGDACKAKGKPMCTRVETDAFCACAVITARGGSKRLPRKNGRKINGLTLIERAVHACREVPTLLSAIIVSTDDDEFAQIARDAGVPVIMRPDELSSDTARLDEAVAHAVEKHYPNMVRPRFTLMVQPNIPIWEEGTISAVVKRMLKGDCTAVLTCHPCKEVPEWAMKVDREGILRPTMLSDKPVPVNSQQIETSYHIDGQVICVETERLLGDFPRTYLGCCGSKKVMHVHDVVFGTDVDEMHDLWAAEAIAAHVDKCKCGC